MESQGLLFTFGIGMNGMGNFQRQGLYSTPFVLEDTLQSALCTCLHLQHRESRLMLLPVIMQQYLSPPGKACVVSF